MPSQIKPIHELNSHAEFFNVEASLEGLSDLQMQLMGLPTARKAAKKYTDRTLNCLEVIAGNREEVITAVTAATGQGGDYFRVPQTVNAQELIALKAQGLVSGHDRVVSITENGKKALAAKWLDKPNALKEAKTKPKFDLNEALQELDNIASGREITRVSANKPGRFKKG